jgi:hypothetical protein
MSLRRAHSAVAIDRQEADEGMAIGLAAAEGHDRAAVGGGRHAAPASG